MKDKRSERFLRQAIIFKAFAHPIRLQLLDALSRGERGVSYLQQILQITKTNLSQHLAVLKSAGLVTSRRAGRQVYCSLATPQVSRVWVGVQGVVKFQDGRNRRVRR